MPGIQRQTPPRPATNGTRDKPSGALGRIKPVGQHTDAGSKMVIYGSNSAGKTFLACGAEKPLLLIGFEDGTKSVRDFEGVDFVQIENTDEVPALAKECGKGRYRSVVVDTATSLQDMVLKELLNLDQVPVQLKWGTVPREVYFMRAEKTKELIRCFLSLRAQNVIVLAQEKDHTPPKVKAKDGDEPAEAAPRDDQIVKPFIAPSLGGETCRWLMENVDHVCQLFVRDQLLTQRKEYVNPTTKEVRVKETTYNTGRKERCLRTERCFNIYASKIRAVRGVEVPEVIVLGPDSEDNFAEIRKYLA